MYKDKYELRELNVHKKLLVYSLCSLHVLVISRPFVDYVCMQQVLAC